MPWVRVACLSDFAGRSVIRVTHEALCIALYRLDNGIFATSDKCPHQGARLSDGEVVGGLIECPAHYALFDIRTGACEGGATNRSVATYPAKAEGDCVLVLI